MVANTETWHSLIHRLRDTRDESAWRQFVRSYGPFVQRYCRRHGLQEADAADITQDVLQVVVRSMEISGYDRRRGTFRSWLVTVIRHKIIDAARARQRQPQVHDCEAVSAVTRQSQETEWRRRESQQTLLERAARLVRREVRHTTWQAFRLTAYEGRPAKEVAARLRMTPSAVYVAKSRVLQRLKKCVRKLSAE